MEFFNSAVGVLQTLVIALGAGLGIWGVINLLEGYGNDKVTGNEAAHGRWRCSSYRYNPRSSSLRSFLLKILTKLSRGLPNGRLLLYK